MMKKITIYTKMMCPYCWRAKSLLKNKGTAFVEIDIDQHPEQRSIMIDRSCGNYTVPQIFIGDRHVGGCDDLYALDRAGKLTMLLG